MQSSILIVILTKLLASLFTGHFRYLLYSVTFWEFWTKFFTQLTNVDSSHFTANAKEPSQWQRQNKYMRYPLANTVERKQSSPVDWMKGFILNSKKVTEYNKHLKQDSKEAGIYFLVHSFSWCSKHPYWLLISTVCNYDVIKKDRQQIRGGGKEREGFKIKNTFIYVLQLWTNIWIIKINEWRVLSVIMKFYGNKSQFCKE